jgi:hypothetical protein
MVVTLYVLAQNLNRFDEFEMNHMYLSDVPGISFWIARLKLEKSNESQPHIQSDMD